MNSESFPVIPISAQVGSTLLAPIRIESGHRIWCKLEIFNPSGSVKDRLALGVLKHAWYQGLIDHTTPVVEASSGSTAISLAFLCSQLSLPFHAVIPEGASEERSWTIRAYGGQVETVSEAQGMAGAEERAKRLAENIGGYYVDQFNNKSGLLVHLQTASEIHNALPSRQFDAFVAGIGTGGTVVGIHQYLSENNPGTKIAVARPQEPSRVLHDIGFTPKGFDSHFERYIQTADPNAKSTISEIEVTERDAIQWTYRLWHLGFPIGPASGVNFAAAVMFAKRYPKNANIVTIFTDRMERYFSTKLFEEIKRTSDKVNSTCGSCCICRESLNTN